MRSVGPVSLRYARLDSSCTRISNSGVAHVSRTKTTVPPLDSTGSINSRTRSSSSCRIDERKDEIHPLTCGLSDQVASKTGDQAFVGRGAKREHRRDEIDRKVVVKQFESGTCGEFACYGQLAHSRWSIEKYQSHHFATLHAMMTAGLH